MEGTNFQVRRVDVSLAERTLSPGAGPVLEELLVGSGLPDRIGDRERAVTRAAGRR